jgi:glycogen operon protein
MYRDSIREFWLRGGAGVGEFARRLTGSADLYRPSGRTPRASINFVTSHDGFTLRDLLTYGEKQNLANQEGNRDGEHHNRGWNCGVEGVTGDRSVNTLRARQQRNLLLTLLTSRGVPMLMAGDEMGRTQLGNNNAYCHDSPLTWLDWSLADLDLVRFTQRLVHFVRHQPGLRPARWLDGRSANEWAEKDVSWFRPDGAEFGGHDWDRAARRALCVHIASHPEPELDVTKPRQSRYLLLFNADPEPVSFMLPSPVAGPWYLAFDTSDDAAGEIFRASRVPGEMLDLLPYSARIYCSESLDRLGEAAEPHAS